MTRAMPGPDPLERTAAALIERERISVFFGVPTMFQFMLRLPDFTSRDFSRRRALPAVRPDRGRPRRHLLRS
ncbi:MAG: hypothetical protein ABSB59_20155 [Streptosporangiaceae bacterium]